MGAAGIFRAVLGADPKRGSERGESHRHRKSPTLKPPVRLAGRPVAASPTPRSPTVQRAAADEAPRRRSVSIVSGAAPKRVR
jgi:hypothetical protein